jgi:hypothetical protein
VKPKDLSADSPPVTGAECESDSPSNLVGMPRAALGELVQRLQAEKFRLETLVCYLLSLNEQLRNGQLRPAAKTTES